VKHLACSFVSSFRPVLLSEGALRSGLGPERHAASLLNSSLGFRGADPDYNMEEGVEGSRRTWRSGACLPIPDTWPPTTKTRGMHNRRRRSGDLGNRGKGTAGLAKGKHTRRWTSSVEGWGSLAG
jgi:hypothetical protein